MEVRKDRSYTIADVYALPEGRRAELIDGALYDMAPPTTTHQRIAGRLYNAISNYIQSNNGKCEPFIAPFGVFLYKDDKTYVEPDVVVVCDKNKLDDKGCHGAPDWLIEVVSEDSVSRDYMVKMAAYLNAGVREYWIVDPLKQMVRIYDFENEKTADYKFSDPVTVGIYSGLQIRVADYLE